MPNIDDTGLNYSTLEGYINWVSSNFAGQLSNDKVNEHSISSDKQMSTIKTALLSAEGEVNGYLRKRGYQVPISDSFVSSINQLKIYVYSIASFELYSRRGITKEQYYKYQRVIQSLQELSNGTKFLPDSPPFVNKTKVAHGHSLPSEFSKTDRRSANSI